MQFLNTLLEVEIHLSNKFLLFLPEIQNCNFALSQQQHNSLRAASHDELLHSLIFVEAMRSQYFSFLVNMADSVRVDEVCDKDDESVIVGWGYLNNIFSLFVFWQFGYFYFQHCDPNYWKIISNSKPQGFFIFPDFVWKNK